MKQLHPKCVRRKKKSFDIFFLLFENSIDGGKGFDWGKVSTEYAKYRNIYPQAFYQKILDLGLCKNGLA